MSKLFFSEHYTQRMLEHLRDEWCLSWNEVKDHFDTIVKTLSLYTNMLSNSKFANRKGNADMVAILERSIFTHLISYPHITKEYNDWLVRDHLQHLKDMEIKHVILRLSEEYIERRLRSSITHRNEYWKQYLDSLWEWKDVVSYFMNWQKSLFDLLKKYESSIDVVVIDVDSDDYEGIANTIYSTIFK